MRSDDSPVVLTVVMISVLVPAIVGLLALIAAVTVYICRQRRQSDIYIPPGIYESSMTSSRGGTYEQPMMSLKGPSHIVGPMEYELAVITPYATSSAAADTHQYDVVAEPDVGVYEKMQSVTLFFNLLVLQYIPRWLSSLPVLRSTCLFPHEPLSR